MISNKFANYLNYYRRIAMSGQQWAFVALGTCFVFVWSLLGAMQRIVAQKPWGGLGMLAAVSAVLTLFGVMAIL
jgi:hypothetical protein